MAKPLILVSNDDGITSNGIRTLVNIVKDLGEVVVVAPDSPQSGMGHAITVGNTLRLEETNIFGDIKAFECSGTPADCVKIAKHFVLKERQPDLVVSGINHGSNTSISVLYSGTMSAAIEAAIDGMPAWRFRRHGAHDFLMQLTGRFAQPVHTDAHLNIRLHMAARTFRLEQGSATLG
jgi:5'-nucleotidase